MSGLAKGKALCARLVCSLYQTLRNFRFKTSCNGKLESYGGKAERLVKRCVNNNDNDRMATI